MRRDRDETVPKIFIQDETETRPVPKFSTRPRVSVPLVSRPRRDRDSRPSLHLSNYFPIFDNTLKVGLWDYHHHQQQTNIICLRHIIEINVRLSLGFDNLLLLNAWKHHIMHITNLSWVIRAHTRNEILSRNEISLHL